MSAERANHAVATLCRVVGVSVSGFHAWLRAIPAVRTRAEAEAELRGQIDRIFAALVHNSDGGRGAAAIAASQAVRCDSGIPSPVIRLSTEQPT